MLHFRGALQRAPRTRDFLLLETTFIAERLCIFKLVDFQKCTPKVKFLVPFRYCFHHLGAVKNMVLKDSYQGDDRGPLYSGAICQGGRPIFRPLIAWQ